MPPAGHWARNKTHNRESLGDTVQDGGEGEGRGLRSEGWDAIIWGKTSFIVQSCRQGVCVCVALMRVARDGYMALDATRSFYIQLPIFRNTLHD